ncbi:MAG: class I SAM-dependent methyltransferase [Deltaproteobacteria bacterium]|nr:class I SAM-dependent methyltransferase [Deltaproteobacteria bacterium]
MKKALLRLLAPAPYWIKRPLFKLWLSLTPAGEVAHRGERLVVGSWDEVANSGEFYHSMHAHRYWWAAQQITPGSLVLDLGCGSGYGAWYLAWDEPRNTVVGLELNRLALSWARSHFAGRFNVEFLDPTGVEEEYESNTFDYVVCFEVVEHDPENVLESILNWLSPSGTLIISTANASPTSVRQYLIDKKMVTVNPTHKHEYTPTEFMELLNTHFSSVELFGQRPTRVNSFEGYLKERRRRGVGLKDFKMDPTGLNLSEVMVAICRGLRS